MKKLFLALLVLSFVGTAIAANYGSRWTNPPVKQVAVTASDSTTYDPPLVALWIGTAGTLRVVLSKDSTATTCSTAPSHISHPQGLFRGRILQVCATATTATALVGYPYDTSSYGE